MIYVTFYCVLLDLILRFVFDAIADLLEEKDGIVASTDLDLMRLGCLPARQSTLIFLCRSGYTFLLAFYS
jgi:hypothetical protein